MKIEYKHLKKITIPLFTALSIAAHISTENTAIESTIKTVEEDLLDKVGSGRVFALHYSEFIPPVQIFFKE